MTRTADPPVPLASCHSKHTKYQPLEVEWACPKCRATPMSDRPFYIVEPDEKADGDCPALHEDDGLGCDNCEHGVSGKNFAKRIMTEKSLVPCTHCKGSGLVKDEKKAPIKRKR